MKIRPLRQLLFLSGLCVQLGLAVSTEEIPKDTVPKITVTREEYSPKPLSPLFYGNFIESGIDKQVEGMWAEMLFNRSFEEFSPRGPRWQRAIGERPRTELAKEEWYHSGHEDNPWYKIPDAQVSWERTRNGQFHHGRYGGLLENRNQDSWGGFAQDGIYLKKGESYTFRGLMRARRHKTKGWPSGFKTDAEVRFYPEGDFSNPVLTLPLKGVDNIFREHVVRIDNRSFEGRATFSVWVSPETVLNVDGFSLMPDSNIHGWRKEVIEMTRRTNPQVIRWPGGCFASFYDWRDGVGPRRSRMPKPDVFWGGLVNNDVGTAEFIQFCREVNAEPFICVNVMTAGPQEAAEWVAYCNASATDSTGALRKRDGFENPFEVKYWELDNETYRKYGPLQYARVCVDFSRAMKAIDPEIKLAMCCYASFEPEMARMLEIAGKHIDLVALRFLLEEQGRRALDIIRAYNEKNGTDIKLVNSEWSARPRGSNQQIRWAYGMNVADQLLSFQRLGGDFLWGNFNNLTNTRHSNTIESPKEGVYMSAAGPVFELLSRSPASRPLRLKGYTPDARDAVKVQVAWDRNRKNLVLIAINRHEVERSVTLDLAAVRARFSKAQISILRAKSVDTCNTLEKPDAIQRNDRAETVDSKATYALKAPPFSIVHIVLSP